MTMMKNYNNIFHTSNKQEPLRLPSRHSEFNGTDKLGLGAHSDDQAVTGNQGYFEG